MALTQSSLGGWRFEVLLGSTVLFNTAGARSTSSNRWNSRAFNLDGYLKMALTIAGIFYRGYYLRVHGCLSPRS